MGTSYRLTIAFVGVTLTSLAMAVPVTEQAADFAVTNPALVLTSGQFACPVGMVDATLSDGAPAWLLGQPLNEWVTISGTTWNGSAADIYNDGNSEGSAAFSNVAVAGTKLIFAATGGHNDSSDNAVKSLELIDDAPAWVLDIARSASVTQNVSHYGDGKPSSRHAYWSHLYSSLLGKLMLHYTRFEYSLTTPTSWTDTNAYDPVSKTWSGAGVYAGGTAALCVDSADTHWTITGGDLKKWVPGTLSTWTTVTVGAVPSYYALPGPMAYDSSRGILFNLFWGDGALFGSGTTAQKFDATTGTKTAITINASAAYTQWQADGPGYSSMEYDPWNDVFLFYDGRANANVYAITPNSGATWDMSILTTTGTAPPLTFWASEGVTAVRQGAFGRMKRIDALQGFAFVPALASNVRFIRRA